MGQVAVAETVKNIRSHIVGIDQRGDSRLVAGLQSFTAAVCDETALDGEAKQELLQLIEEVTRQLEQPVEHRRLGVIRQLLGGINGLITAAPRLVQAYEALEPLLRSHFQLPPL